MRSLLAFLAGVIAIGAIVVALPSLWLTERVVEPSGFRATAVKMGENSDVRDFMADTITTQIANRAGSAAGTLARPIAVRYTHSAAFTEDFVDLATQQHRWLFEPPPAGVDPEVMQLDLTGMVRRVASQANPAFAGLIPGPVLVPVSHRDRALEAGRYREPGRQVKVLAYGSIAVALLAGLLALLISGNRAAMLSWLGFGGVLSAVVSWAGGYYFAARAKDEVSGTEAGVRHVAEVTIDGLVDNLHQWALVVGGVGAVVLVVGLAIRSFDRG